MREHVVSRNIVLESTVVCPVQYSTVLYCTVVSERTPLVVSDGLRRRDRWPRAGGGAQAVRVGAARERVGAGRPAVRLDVRGHRVREFARTPARDRVAAERQRERTDGEREERERRVVVVEAVDEVAVDARRERRAQRAQHHEHVVRVRVRPARRCG